MASEKTKLLMEERRKAQAGSIKFLTQNVGENRAGLRKRVKGVARMVHIPFARAKEQLEELDKEANSVQEVPEEPKLEK